MKKQHHSVLSILLALAVSVPLYVSAESVYDTSCKTPGQNLVGLTPSRAEIELRALNCQLIQDQNYLEKKESELESWIKNKNDPYIYKDQYYEENHARGVSDRQKEIEITKQGIERAKARIEGLKLGVNTKSTGPAAGKQLPPKGKVLISAIDGESDAISFRGHEQWIQAKPGMLLEQGHEIAASPDGAAVLLFPDGSTVRVEATTQIKIASYFTKGGIVQTEILLKVGQIFAEVKKEQAVRSDFKIRAPTATASVRGTTFSVAYNKKSTETKIAVAEGSVLVQPKGSKAGRPFILVAGKKASGRKTSAWKIAPMTAPEMAAFQNLPPTPPKQQPLYIR